MKNLGMRLVLALLLVPVHIYSQTSWKGTTSIDWSRASNWTNGVPTSTVDAIIGDASFTGANQPKLTAAGSSCKSLTIGAGTKVSVLTVAKGLSVSGNITIGANGTINHNGKDILLTGNWNNSGSYSGSASATITFGGSVQTISGSTPFRSVTVNSGTTLKLASNISVSHQLDVNGIVDPGEAPTFTISGNGNIVGEASATLLVKASTFTGNYGMTGGGSNVKNTCTVDYAATTINQTVSNPFTYGNLRISGALTKTLNTNLTVIGGNLTVASATFDLSTFTANGSGGTFLVVANGATLKIGGTNTFPSGSSPNSLGVTSTVIYSGGNQAVGLQTYGNLTLTGSGGAAAKTFPAGAMTIAGNLTSTTGSSPSLSFTAGGAITVNGNISLGASTTFSGGAFSHRIGGDWINNGTFTGNTSTVTLTGVGKSISGSGSNNFNNLTIAGAGITCASGTNILMSGNFSTTGAGTFSQPGPGTATMSGAAKTIAGSGITFNDFTASGSISSGSSFTIAGNFTVSGSYSATAGTITMSGSTKTIGGAGTLTFNSLNVTGSVSTARSFSMKSDLSLAGTFSASAGTVTFSGTSTVSGAPNFFNITLNGTRMQLGTGCVLGVGGALTLTAGVFDATSTTPNTVDFDASGAQTIASATYYNLNLSTGGVKTAAGALAVNGNLTINAGATFNGGTLAHSIAGNWINNGVFTANTSTVQLVGTRDASITGTTTFNALTINKSSSANLVVLNNSVTVGTLGMTSGTMHTGANSITITSSRTGNGIIIGTITRTQAFSDGLSYAFEGPNNTVTFASGAAGVTSVTVGVVQGAIADFIYASSINREYDVAVSSGGSYQAALRLHYEDDELNGNIESLMQEWRFNGSSWVISGMTANDSVNNWTEQNGLSSIDGRWSLSDNQNVVAWNGSVSSAWEDSANWSSVAGVPTLPPSPFTIVLFGYAPFTNQPSVTSPVTVKNIVFENAQQTALTIGAGGSLVSNGNITGVWSASAAHSIDVGSQTLTAGGIVNLSDGTNGNSINLNIGSGSVSIGSLLTQSGDATISWNGSGSLSLAGDFNHSGGTFSAGSGTMIFNGSRSQIVGGGITYNNLTIDKSAGTATLLAPVTVAGNLTLSTAGTFAVGAPLTITGSVNINAGTTLDAGSSTISVGGDWNRAGSFVAGTGTVSFDGSGSQTIGATTFNNLSVDKSGGTAVPTGNLPTNGDLSVLAGALDLLTFTADRTAAGGTLTLSGAATLRIGASSTFPANYSAYALSNTSTVEYYAGTVQLVAAVPYGNLTLSNGGSNAKVLAGSTTVSGDLVINSGATLDADSAAASIAGNWTNNGSFIPSTSSITLGGSSKSLSGQTSFNNLTVTGSYSGTGDVSVGGTTQVLGAYQAGSTSMAFSGDLLNAGTFGSSGSVTFNGTGAQAIGLNSGFSSSGSVNFNGSVSPTFTDLASPVLASVNINNTGGVSPDLGWTVAGAFTVAGGATFTGGAFTHTFGTNFTNNGTVSSAGELVFNPSAAAALTLLGTSFSSTGTVDFSGTGDISVSGGAPAFSSVIVSNTGANGVTPLSNWSIAGDLLIAGSATFNGGSGLLHTVTGNWTDQGTYNGGTSTVVLNNATGSSIAGDGNTTFNNLTISGTVTALSPFNISGNFADNGTFDATGVAVSFTGSSLSLIGGTTVPVPIDILTAAKTSATAALAANLTGVSELIVTSGTLNISTFSVTQNILGGIVIVNAGAVLEIGGSAALPTFDQYAFDPASTVLYDGPGSQAVLSSPVYGNLSMANSGTRTPDGALTVAGDFSISGGTFAGGALTHSVGGNWNMTGGSFTNAGTTILFGGTADQTISSTGSFNNMIINKASGSCIAGSGITIDGVLAFTAGNIVTGANKVIISPTGSVSRTSGQVVGNLQKYLPSGPSSATFEIGDASTYTPVSVSFTNVLSAGNLTAATAPGEHPDVSNSAVDTHLDVNRYWSLTNGGIAFSTCDATFNFVPSDVDSGADPNLFIAQKLDTSTWSFANVGIRTATSTQVTGMTSFSDFAFGILKHDTIFASSNSHGTIAPSGAIRVLYGADTSFTITPDSGFLRIDLLVDGVSVGPESTYAFVNVTKSHTIQAVFGYPAPHLTSVGPVTSSFRGQTLDFVFAGSNFISGVTSLNLGGGITVNTLIVANPETLLANITIGPLASPGPRNFSVTNSGPGGGTSESITFTVLNHVPGSFSLLSPADGDTVRLTTIPHPVTFTWHPSVDLDPQDTLTYILHLPGTSLGDSVTVRGDTTVSVAGLMSLLTPHSSYSWSVSATDGFDTVASTGTFTYRTSDTLTGVSAGGSGIPGEYALHQNYPNPFNPTTTIQFDLPHASVVTLVVYNLLGEEIATLIDRRTMEAGYQQAEFDGAIAPSGVYLYRLSADEPDGTRFVRVNKMILLK
jgi:hypothetical protein